jgi:hypothetical protein
MRYEAIKNYKTIMEQQAQMQQMTGQPNPQS